MGHEDFSLPGGWDQANGFNYDPTVYRRQLCVCCKAAWRGRQQVLHKKTAQRLPVFIL